MADLPMAQIPNFQLGGTQIPLSNNAAAIGQAVQGGAGLALQQQNQLAQQQQAQQALMQQRHEKMLEVGADMVINGGDDTQDTAQSLIRQAIPYLTGQP